MIVIMVGILLFFVVLMVRIGMMWGLLLLISVLSWVIVLFEIRCLIKLSVVFVLFCFVVWYLGLLVKELRLLL